MRNFFKIFGIIAIAATIVLSTTGCENEPDGNTPQTVTYTGVANDNTIYTLKITENLNRAVYTPQAGDSYELTAGTKKSTGTVNSYASSKITLQPSNSEQIFTATVSGNHMTEITGTIKWTDNTTGTALKLEIPLTVSGTFSGQLQGKSFSNIEIHPYFIFYGNKGDATPIPNDKIKTLTSPGSNIQWSIGEIPFTGTPTEVLIVVYFNNHAYSKDFFCDVDNYNEITRTISGINIDVGNVKPITLSGTINNLPSGYDQNRWEIWALTKHKYGIAGSNRSKITISENSATWSITLLSFKEEETDIYFQLRGYKDNKRDIVNSTSFQTVSNDDKSNINLNYTDFGNN